MSSSGSARHAEGPGRPETIRAPLFARLVESFDDQRRHVILDLGRARAGTVELFGHYRCRLDVVDLPSMLDQMPRGEDQTEEALAAWLERQLPPAGSEGADLVLCWNLLNYLPLKAIELLSGLLTSRTAPGARLHALIEYSATRMPTRPPSFAPSGLELMADPAPGSETVPAPRYTPKALEKRLPGFVSDQTMLLGNGMQEFLYRRQS